MKKMFAAALLACMVSISLSAQDDAEKSKTLGGSAGLRLSILGIEPTASFIFNHMEIEASCPLARYSMDSNATIGYAPGASFGYISSPFDKGWQNGVGISYYWFTPSYIDSVAAIFSGVTSTAQNGNLHAFSLYYRGGIRFRKGFNMYFRVMVPLVLYAHSDTDKTVISIIDREFVSVMLLGCLCTQAIGFRFTF
ncbi:MAG: hypothetical protein J6I73_06760 [Treponema sp.]|nr:hypothetical protein [Treponema sp.]